MKQKGIILAILGLGAYLAYKTFIVSTGTISGSNSPSIRPLATIIPQTQKTYIDTQHGFAFIYPADFIYSATSADFIPPFNLQNLIAVVRKSGFKDATAQYSEAANFAVSSSDDTANCYKFNGNTLTDIKTINKTVFKTVSTSSGATGHTIDASIYRLVTGKICLEIATSIQTQTGSGVGLDSLQDKILADQQNLQSELNQILSTFEFTN